MLVMFPKQAVLLFGLLFLLGVLFGWISDWLAKLLQIIPCEKCELTDAVLTSFTLHRFTRR